METVLLDTDVVSFLLKGDSRAEAYVPHLQDRRLALSFMTVAELYQWAAVRNWGARRRQQLDQTLRTYLILPFDIEVCRQWGEVRAASRRQGRPISPQDAWIAASALHHRIALVTGNPNDFEHIAGLTVITSVV